MLTKIFYYGFTMLLNRIFGLLPLQKNRVLFLSDVRSDLSGNFRFVYGKLPAGLEVRTSLKADRSERRSFGAYLHQCVDLATSKYIFLDDFAECTAYMHVRRGQELIQLWHGSGAFKRFGHSRGNGGDLGRIHPGYKRYTRAVVSSEEIRSCYAEAFSIPVEHVKAYGIPRTDVFFNETYMDGQREAFYAAYPQIRGRKVILFAPTYRGSRLQEACYDFDRLDLARLYERFGDTHVLLLKWHPALYRNLQTGRMNGPDISTYKGFVYDVSDVREVNDLLPVTDVLVTDYSSVIFDYALLKKPIVYFVYDLEEYEGGRGLYFPFREYRYGDMAADTDELITAIENENMDPDRRRAFEKKFIQANDGHASERVCEAVFGQHG